MQQGNRATQRFGIDQHLHEQQNLVSRKIAILVLPFANWPKLGRRISEIVTAIETLKPGDYVALDLL